MCVKNKHWCRSRLTGLLVCWFRLKQFCISRLVQNRKINIIIWWQLILPKPFITWVEGAHRKLLDQLLILSAFLSWNSEVHTMLGEKEACATASPHLYIRTYKCSVTQYSSSCIPSSEISTLEWVMSWRLLWLKVVQTWDTWYIICFSFNVLARANRVPILTMSYPLTKAKYW